MTEEVTKFVRPKWHWLATWGLWICIVGAAVILVAWFNYPEAPSAEETASATFTDQLAAYKTNLNIYLLLNWFGTHMLSGGFFMWLAGCVVNAIRHPKHF